MKSIKKLIFYTIKYRIILFFEKNAEIFGHIKKKQYLCTRF